MNLDTYEELTGITVPSDETALYNAQIRRTRSMMETMLGFTLDPSKVNQNLYNELGKTSNDCSCPSVDTEDLLPADDVVTAYRLYRYNDLDKYFHVDPFTKVNKVKLVYVKEGAGDTGVTLKTFEDDEIRLALGRDGIGKYLEHCLTCLCTCSCQECVQLAVDADWLWTGDLPDDLLYVWADMITYYVDGKKNIKSETIDTHSYTKFDKTAPETEPQNLAILKKYAGPYGSVSVMPV